MHSKCCEIRGLRFILLSPISFRLMSSSVARERELSAQKLGSLMEILVEGRYVILLMPLFQYILGLSTMSFSLFLSTSLVVQFTSAEILLVDPSWRGSRTELPYINSLKMKMSILVGIAQMNLGLILCFFNARLFGSSLDIRCHFVQQMIFLYSLFGYLPLLIIIKWCTGSQTDLYHVIIYMFLVPLKNLVKMSCSGASVHYRFCCCLWHSLLSRGCFFQNPLASGKYAHGDFKVSVRRSWFF